MKTLGRKNGHNFVDNRQVLDSGSVNEVTTKLNVVGISKIYIYGKKATGTIAGATIKLQCSPDGVTWNPTADELVFADETAKDVNAIEISCKWVRLKVTIKSTIASTANVIIQGK